MTRTVYAPLTGTKVLSFETAFSLPAGTRVLAELGAEVVRVEGPTRPSRAYSTIIEGALLSKPCVGINLKHADGRSLAMRMANQADVVCHNFRPSLMEGFGLSPAHLRAEKPSLIVLQLTGYGTPGPWSEYPAYGPSTEAAGGLNASIGLPGDDPIKVGSGVFSDQLSGRFAALAVISALRRRRTTGEGYVIDLSMTEAITALLGDLFVRSQLSGGNNQRVGNRDHRFAPQGIYPCTGRDQWVAITIVDDLRWKAFVSLTDDERLADSALATAAGRAAAHSTVDDAIAGWTSKISKEKATELLQSRGIAAGPVRHPRDFFFDEHLDGQSAFQLVNHPSAVLGFTAHPYLTSPLSVRDRARVSLTDQRPTGADNKPVLLSWLGIGDSELEELTASGALIEADFPPVEHREPSPGTIVESDVGTKLGLPRAGEEQ